MRTAMRTAWTPVCERGRWIWHNFIGAKCVCLNTLDLALLRAGSGLALEGDLDCLALALDRALALALGMPWIQNGYGWVMLLLPVGA